jgi:hypothetical protein
MSMMTSLVPYKSLCNIPASFAPDAVWPVIRLTFTPYHGRKRYPPFLTSSLLSRSQSLIYSIQLYYTYLHKSCLRFSLSFTTRGVSALRSIRWFTYYSWKSYVEDHLFHYTKDCQISQFARPPPILLSFPKVFHHLYSIHSQLFIRVWFKTHTFEAIYSAGFKRTSVSIYN